MPDWTTDIRARIASVRLAPAREAEIVEELSQHLDDRWHELVAAGLDPEAAERAALAEFRGIDVLARHLSPLRQARWADPAPVGASGSPLKGLGADLRHALRGLRATPGFTVAALLVLALGIGATTAIFSVVDAVVLRPLPFDQPDRLVALGELSMPLMKGKAGPVPAPPKPGELRPLSRSQPQNYLDWKLRQQAFESLSAVAYAEFTARWPGIEPEDLLAARVNASFFDVLRIRPALGRAFTEPNEQEGSHRVAVLSDALWRRRFNASPAIIGQSIPTDDGNYEVVGVLPASVTYPVGSVPAADLLVPYVVPPNERVRGRGFSIYLEAIARLKPEVSIAQAQADMDRIADAIASADPVWGAGAKFGVQPLQDYLVGSSMRSWMVMLLSAVAIVLLIACANVANLLLARGNVRAREVAVRAALGASPWRLVRESFIESLCLSAIAMAAAVVLAWWAIGVLKAAMPADIPRVTTIALNLRVLAAAAGLSLVTGLLFGTVPALTASKLDLAASLKDGTRSGGTGRGTQRLRSALVILEVALAVVLLVGAALFIGSFVRLMQVDSGFDAENVLTAQIYSRSLRGERPPDRGAQLAEIVERVRRSPHVVRAAAASPGIPLTGNMTIDGLQIPGGTVEGDGAVSIKTVTPDYHRALGIPLRTGRLFEPSDREGSGNVIILSESAARTFFPGGDAVGRTVALGRTDGTIVGVVADVRQNSLEKPPRPEVYLPLAQGRATSGYLVVRTEGDPYEVLPAVKAAVADVLPGLPLRRVGTLEQAVARQTAQRRLNMLMLALFGVLGLVICAVGVSGLLAFIVSRRTREIGIRMVLGATRGQMIRMILTKAGGLVVTGVVIGGVSAWFLSTTARAFLFGLEPHDARAFAVASVTVIVAALVASLIPANRAATVDPTVALRAE